MNPDAIRDIKPLLIPAINWFLLAGFIILGLALVALVIWWFFLRPKPIVPPKPAWEVALERLNDLLSKDLLKQGQFYLFYDQLSDIVRRYIQQRFGIDATCMSTQEFSKAISSMEGCSPQDRTMIIQLLQQADIVKFAKGSSVADEANAYATQVRQLIETTRPKEDGI